MNLTRGYAYAHGLSQRRDADSVDSVNCRAAVVSGLEPISYNGC
jgi:hypothetical protein